MKTIKNNKSGLYVFMAAGLMLYSCQNEFAIQDQGLSEGKYPLTLNVGTISRAGADDVKKAWTAGDEFGAKIEGNDKIGKYKITDVATGATEAIDGISWHTSKQTEVYAWYPVADQSDIALGGYAGAGLLMAKTMADYTAAANLTFSSPLAKVVCSLSPAPGVTLDENAEVSLNTFTKANFSQGVISPVDGSKGDLKMEKETVEEKVQYTALICPGEVSADNYFLKVVSGTNTYKMTMSDVAMLEGGKTYTFNVTVKDKGEIVWSVSTLAGTGTAASAGNNIATETDALSANLYKPFWLTLDNNSNLYIIEYDAANNGAFHKLNLNTNKIQTVIKKAHEGLDGGFMNFYAADFTPDFKNLIISQDRGSGNNDMYAFPYDSETAAITIGNNPKENSRIKELKGMAISPIDKDYLFVVEKTGRLIRLNLTYDGDNITAIGDKEQKDLLKIQEKIEISTNPEEDDTSKSPYGNNWYDFNINFSPDGTYAYFVTRNRNLVVKANYDASTHEFKDFVLVAGKHSYSGGYSDGTDENAQFKNPHQGAFDAEGNFYLCDSGNHCIRKIDSQGNVTTFTGKQTEDAYKDGSLSDATFKAPTGIVFDAVKNIFYVADWGDHRIRVIKGQ